MHIGIKERLLSFADADYKEFICPLIPTVDRDTVIGIRTPKLRKLAARLYGTEEARDFLKELPHKYYEENNLHAFLIEKISNYDDCIAELNRFLPYVDNWSTCDSMAPRVLKKHPQELLRAVTKWIKSKHTYTVRYGIGTLMKYYLDENFDERYLDEIASVHSEEYYIRMMVAWYFATALAKQYEATLPYIENKKLDTWIHNKTIQKAVESYRITPEQKAYLRTLKIKERV